MYSSLEEAQKNSPAGVAFGRDERLARSVYQSGSAAPTLVVPAFVGQRYNRTGSNTWYTAYGTAAGEWALDTN